MNEAAIDQYSRPLKDLRISVTDRCNFRCRYCMPAEIYGPDFPFLKHSEILTFEEIERIVNASAQLGVEKVKITGGEPLLRKQLPELIHKLFNIEGIRDIGLTTNGMLLPNLAAKLKSAGLKRINVSLDAIDEELFAKMNGVGISPENVKKGIRAAQQAGLQVKVNMVVQKGINESEIVPMADYCRDNNLTLRFIEFMDVGTSNGWNWDQIVTKKEIMAKLIEHFEFNPLDANYYGEVAKRYQYDDQTTEIGFITSVSESFCSTCTRGRLSADGKIYTCLFAENGHDIKSFLRSGSTDAQLREFIAGIWEKRNDRYSDERTEETVKNKKKIEMSYIGG
ncbi:GTP 3',8-cyclase MoaA [Falsibacillus albus]|uniref:GTP 3',8-cyclase n=1 Tax=Falsibacillus albus TaxID=2478915 RepID=A0A3L7K3Z2_9BACI|nr:GTP 3',8-cyclase MoaA [Falsibacillus albus]RLQ95432.1 GTP 3',8-cyclase MoaA [Falsibacillus albus]